MRLWHKRNHEIIRVSQQSKSLGWIHSLKSTRHVIPCRLVFLFIRFNVKEGGGVGGGCNTTHAPVSSICLLEYLLSVLRSSGRGACRVHGAVISRPCRQALHRSGCNNFQAIGHIDQILWGASAQKLFDLGSEAKQNEVFQFPSPGQHDINSQPPVVVLQPPTAAQVNQDPAFERQALR